MINFNKKLRYLIYMKKPPVEEKNFDLVRISVIPLRKKFLSFRQKPVTFPNKFSKSIFSELLYYTNENNGCSLS